MKRRCSIGYVCVYFLISIRLKLYFITQKLNNDRECTLYNERGATRLTLMKLSILCAVVLNLHWPSHLSDTVRFMSMGDSLK